MRQPPSPGLPAFSTKCLLVQAQSSKLWSYCAVELPNIASLDYDERFGMQRKLRLEGGMSAFATERSPSDQLSTTYFIFVPPSLVAKSPDSPSWVETSLSQRLQRGIALFSSRLVFWSRWAYLGLLTGSSMKLQRDKLKQYQKNVCT